MELKYDPRSGAAYLRLRNRPVVETEEIAPGVLMDIADDGLPVGFDLLDAAAMIDDIPATTKPEAGSRSPRSSGKGIIFHLAEEKAARPA